MRVHMHVVRRLERHDVYKTYTYIKWLCEPGHGEEAGASYVDIILSMVRTSAMDTVRIQ